MGLGTLWGEAVGLTRGSIDAVRSRIVVRTTAVEVHGRVTLGHEPKTKRSQRTVPVARSIMRRIEDHLTNHVGPEADALGFTAAKGGPLFRSTFARHLWHPAVDRAGLAGLTFHGPGSSVAILVAAGSKVREVSAWAGAQQRRLHPDPLRRPVEDGSAEAVDRLDALLGGDDLPPGRPDLDG